MFAENCHYIEKLVLAKCFKLTDQSAQSLSRNCPNLRHLNFSSCKNITNATCAFVRLVLAIVHVLFVLRCSLPFCSS